MLGEVITSLPLEFTTRLHVAELDATLFSPGCWIQQPHRCRTTDVERTPWSAVYPVGMSCAAITPITSLSDDVATHKVTTVAVRTYAKVGVARRSNERTLTA
ncbi:hypothetical protein ACNKHM_10585 [Shigella sonnei]